MSKNIERCPKDIKKLVNPKTGRCVMETSPIIKKLIQEGYTILVTPNKNQPPVQPKNDDVKIFKVCPKDIKRLVNPNTGRCINITSPIVKKLMSQGWSIAFNDPGVTPLVIKPKNDIDIDKLKKNLDVDKDGIVSINEYLGSFEITPLEEDEKKGAFWFLRTTTNIPRFLKLMMKEDAVFKKNLCWFNQKYYLYINPLDKKQPKFKINTNYSSTGSWKNYRELNHAQLYNAPLRQISTQGSTDFIIHPGAINSIRTCKERYIAMGLSFSTSEIDIPKVEGGHANVLIFDTVLKTIDRYDPHGNLCGKFSCPSYDQDKVDDILKAQFKKILPEYKFIYLSVACPTAGIQHVEPRNRNGYCVTWSLMFTVLRILNPGKSYEEINKHMLIGTNTEIFSKMLKFAKFYSDIIKKHKNIVMVDA